MYALSNIYCAGVIEAFAWHCSPIDRISGSHVLDLRDLRKGTTACAQSWAANAALPQWPLLQASRDPTFPRVENIPRLSGNRPAVRRELPDCCNFLRLTVQLASQRCLTLPFAVVSLPWSYLKDCVQLLFRRKALSRQKF